MKKTSLIFAILCAALFCSCIQIENPSITLSAVSLSVASDVEKSNVTVTSNYSWSASSDASWVTVKPSSGNAGTTEVTLAITESPTGDARSATVTFTCMNVSKTLTITQQEAPVVLTDQLVIKHNLSNFTVPEISGKDLSGTVDWGDGKSEAYSKGLKHNYGSAKNYTMKIEVSGQESFSFPDIVGVTEINLSDF